MRDKQTIFRYGGYEMRSHSETRWAAIMDAMSVAWVYESRTVVTRHGGYMPDFFLPAVGAFVEVKGPIPSQIEREKAWDAQRITGFPVVFAYGRAEMIGGELFHGMLSYFSERGEVSYSTAEIGAAVRRWFGINTYAAYLSAGEHQRRPDFVCIGDIVEEVITGWMDRQARETYLKGLHGPINQRKLAQHRQASRAEWALSQFSQKIIQCWNAQEAA